MVDNVNAKTQKLIDAQQWQRPLTQETESIENTVSALLARIRQEGDQAIAALSEQFDGFPPQIIALKHYRDYALNAQQFNALETAASRIEKFATFQYSMYESRSFSDEFGEFGQRIVPIETMGAYIPGGRFPLVSTALMTLIPARVAGCQTRVATSPSAHEALLAAASLGGATHFVHLGGAQAIASLAYGSQWNPPVDMIVGPGNAYVNAAKGQLQNKVKIDTLAGPSELLVIADKSAPIEWIKYDLLAQSEHDPMALSVCTSWDKAWLEQLFDALYSDPTGKTMIDNGNCQCVFANSVASAIDFSNRFAPEHLSVMSSEINTSDLLNYGALFNGRYSAVAFGDYCSGPNHTLPTMGFARQKGGLSVGDFLKILSVQTVNERGNDKLFEIGEILSQLEGLTLHEQSMRIRQKH